MPELSVSSGGDGIIKDFLVILIGAMVGAGLVYLWDITVGTMLSNQRYLPGGGVVVG